MGLLASRYGSILASSVKKLHPTPDVVVPVGVVEAVAAQPGGAGVEVAAGVVAVPDEAG